MIKKILICILVFIVQSCTGKKSIIYLQNTNTDIASQIDYYDAYIQPNDILKITIGTPVPEAAIPYNKQTNPVGGSVELLKLEGYLVSEKYMIKLPVIGAVSVKDKTPAQLEEVIKEELLSGNHLDSPNVDVRLLNSKVTILGEVNAPGTYNFSEASITLLQALGYAGDLTINGKRNDILVIREENGIRHISNIDLTSANLLKNQYYTIKQNDVIYVKPNMAKVKSGGYINNFGTVLSVTSILISTIILITR
ncbi:polysaccharide biosynthesis/export family protein [Flavivirga aquimarina]|uniref:Polysaccharide biosynthesis/export family protein n=1 Tax=Flavivirga aquimarina TaxID=2027862 RepID=A0ABT8W719_9FLAO|nr:polysaccharide biosynthesis/export family protein [Flavivirga aquimarina]MDO5968913.1 polysaccharide biosynthesis/export family protein [Flavivirga aquimarina]